MAYLLNPANSIQFRGGTRAILFDDDPDFPQYQIFLLMGRASPQVEWQVVTNGSFGVGNWGDRVAAAGGWAAWITRTIEEINKRIAYNLGDSSPPPVVGPLPAGVPTTVAEWKAWMVANIWVEDTATSSYARFGSKPVLVDPPSDPVGGFAANQVFYIGKQLLCWHIEVDGNNQSSLSCQRYIGPGPTDWQAVKLK